MACLQQHDIDAAIERGLMEFTPCADGCCGDVQPLLAAQQPLRDAWAARDRYRARAARLQRRAAERDARRALPAPTLATAKPTLPPSAAAILARAKAKAAGRLSE